MAGGERRVDMVRLPREERLVSMEDVFGRDVTSVFPKTAAASAGAAASLDAETIKAAIGARKFISETELDELRSGRGVTADDGAVSVDKPLAVILKERKEAKDAEFKETIRKMNIGKNRPLDEDELDWYTRVADEEARKETEALAAQRSALNEFRVALYEQKKAAAEAVAAAAAATGRETLSPAESAAAPKAVHGPQLPPKTAQPPPPKAAVRAMVKVKPRAPPPGQAAPPTQQRQAAEPPAKRLKSEGGQQPAGQQGGQEVAAAAAAAGHTQAQGGDDDDDEGVATEGLTGLLGYGSGSGSGSDDDDNEGGEG